MFGGLCNVIRVPCVALVLGLWLCFSAGFAVNPANAQGLLSGGRIDEIRVEGSQRIEPETVRSYMRVNPGDNFDPVALDRSLKASLRPVCLPTLPCGAKAMR